MARMAAISDRPMATTGTVPRSAFARVMMIMAGKKT